MTPKRKGPTSRNASIPAAVFDLAGDAFVVMRNDRTIARINAAAERLFGIPSSDVAGRELERLFTSLPQALLDAGPAPQSRPAVGRRCDDSEIPLEVTARRAYEDEADHILLRVRAPESSSTEIGERIKDASRIGGFGYWRQDLVTGVVKISSELREILGVGPHQGTMEEPALRDHLHPDDLQEYGRALEDTRKTGARLDVTHRILTADRKVKYVRTVGQMQFDSDHNPVELVGFTFDVTGREMAYAALRESEDTLSAIVNSTTAMIYIKDVEGKYLLVNRRLEEAFGIKNSEQRGKTDYAYLPRDIADAVRENDRQVCETGEPVEFEELVPYGGQEHIFISIKFPLRRPSGEIYAVCGISTDITERKHAEAELEKTKRSLERQVEERTATLRRTNLRLQQEITEREETAMQLQRLLDTAREGVWVIDNTGYTTFANPRMAEILGYQPDELMGRSFYDFMAEERRPEAEYYLERRRRGIAEDHDFEFQRKDGSRVWTLVSTGPVNDHNGNMIGALAMVTDITDRKQAEDYQTLLLQELDHRVKNTLATVTALAEITMAGTESVGAFAEAFNGRIQAMARTHEALAGAKWMGISFENLAALVLAPIRTDNAARVSIGGDAVHLPPRAVTPLALTLNELGTNALKHGALSGAEGRVQLGWRRRGDGYLTMTWQEVGGPPVHPERSEGTGLRLIRGFIEYELGGSLDLDFQPDGLICHVRIPPPNRD